MLFRSRGETPGEGGPTIAEGIAVKDPGTLTRPIVEKLVEDILIVDEAGLERGVQLLLEIEKTVAEGAGGAPLAAVLANSSLFTGRKVGLIISGGNIDSRLLASVLMRGMARDGRIARLRVEITDAPGTLAKVHEYAAAHGNAEMVKKFQDARRTYYRSLPTFEHFGKGWLARVERTKQEATEMTA